MKKTLFLMVFLSLSIYAFSKHPFLNHEGFVVILSDLHFPFAKEKVEFLIDQVCEIKPGAVFILGDLTEMGSDYEFSELDKIISRLNSYEIDVYETPGNHDTRWSPRNRKGESGFKGFCIDAGPFEFLGVDTSMYFEHHGHIGILQLQWIETRLKQSEKPVVIMAHHPFGGPANFTDDGWKLMNLINDSNVPVVLVGHGHSYDIKGMYNGAWFQMVGAAKDGWYTVLSWKDGEIFLWALNTDGVCNLIRQIPAGKERRYSQILKVNLRKIGEKGVSLYFETEGIKQITLTINNSIFKKFSDFEKRLEVPVELHNDACIFAKILAEGVDGFTERYIFSDFDSSKLLWKFQASDGVFSNPVCSDGKICFADLSGTVYVLDDYGKLLWKKKFSGPFVSNVVVRGRKLIFGDLMGNLAAYDLETFDEIWSMNFDCPVFSISSGQKNIAVGSGENLYLVDPDCGRIIYKFYMYGTVQSPARFVSPYFLQTSWGGVLSIIDENGKLVKNFAVGAGYETAAPCTPELFDDWIVFTNTSGALHGQHISMKTKRWRKSSLGVGYSSVEKDNSGNAYVSNINGTIYKFNPVDGEILWKSNVDGQIYDSSPRIVGEEMLVVCTIDGNIFFLDLEKGEVLEKLYLGPGFIFSKAYPYKSGVLVASMNGTIAFIDLSK